MMNKNFSLLKILEYTKERVFIMEDFEFSLNFMVFSSKKDNFLDEKEGKVIKLQNNFDEEDYFSIPLVPKIVEKDIER